MRGLADGKRRIAAVVLAAVMLICALPVSAAAETANTVAAICALNLRASASTSSSVYRVLSEGTSLALLEDSDSGWAHVSDGNVSGYVSARYLTVPEGSLAVMTAVAEEEVSLRSGRGESYSRICAVRAGAELKVTDNTDEDWAGVEYGSREGYVSKDFVTIRLSMGESDTSATEPAASTHRNASFRDIPSLPSSSDNSHASPSKLILSSRSVSLDIDSTYALTAMDEASRPVMGGLSYSSSDSGVASVSGSGLITGLKSGAAVITVTDTSGGLKAECAVRVSSSVSPVIQPATQAPTQAQRPTQPATQASGEPSDLKLSASSANVYKGCYFHILVKSGKADSWSSSNTSVATVSSDGIVTANNAGTAVITARSGSKAATCKITVVRGDTVSLSHYSASVTAGKTFLARSYTYGVSWTSSDTSVATVNNGYILAKKAGKTVITVSSASGAATMLVTVTQAAPVRFAYTSPNCAAKGERITLIAITDTDRTAVRFDVTSGSRTYQVNADPPVSDGNTLVWKGYTTLTSAGTYNVTAYSQLGGAWSTCADARTTAFAADSDDMTTTVCTARRASDGVIKLIANFEGYISAIYDDPITGDPTVGYGRVIYSGEQFYNTMTKEEAFAYLVQTVNNEGYASKVNSFLVGNGVKFNQQQFDALVCLVYNTGAGILTGDTELQYALLDCHDGSGGTVKYYINGSGVRIRKGAGVDSAIIRELPYDTPLTLISDENKAWYKVRLSDGTVGFVSSDYISKRCTGGKLDLNYVDRQSLIDKICQYHHAGGGCVYGLLYRRVDECEMFFYGDYARNYGVYNYDISFTCELNPSFHT